MKKLLKIFYSGGEICTYIYKQIEKTVDHYGIYKLYYSNDRFWTRPGTPAYSLINHGNGFVFVGSNGRNIRLDYSEAEALRILLDLENKNHDNNTYELTDTHERTADEQVNP